MPHPPIIEAAPDIPRNIGGWRSGNLIYDLSSDANLAAEGDEAAIARLETARHVALRQRVRESRES